MDGATTHNWKAGQAVQGFRLKSTVTILGAGQVPISPTWFQVPATIRCDKTFNLKTSPDGKSRGCVFPAIHPTMKLPLTNAGQANVAWSMNNLTDHWGLEGKGKPLKVEGDDAVADSNRGKICRDGTFKKDPRVPQDSCDEFPFAMTKQSGGQLGLKGKDCAEIRPKRIAVVPAADEPGPLRGRRETLVLEGKDARRLQGERPSACNPSVHGTVVVVMCHRLRAELLDLFGVPRDADARRIAAKAHKQLTVGQTLDQRQAERQVHHGRVAECLRWRARVAG